jgi:hypothetical protein
MIRVRSAPNAAEKFFRGSVKTRINIMPAPTRPNVILLRGMSRSLKLVMFAAVFY